MHTGKKQKMGCEAGRAGRGREGGKEDRRRDSKNGKAATEERGSVRASEPRLMHVYVMCGYAGAGKVPSSLQNEHDDHETNLQPTTEERHTTHDLRPATGDPRPATCDRRPATCNVRLETKTSVSSCLRTGPSPASAPHKWRKGSVLYTT